MGAGDVLLTGQMMDGTRCKTQDARFKMAANARCAVGRWDGGEALLHLHLHLI
jgi:hypothetical protein